MKPYYQDDYVTIYNGDCKEILPQLDVKVDLVLTDPPYNFEVVGGAFNSNNPSTKRTYLSDLIDIGCGNFNPDEHFGKWVEISKTNSIVVFCNKFLIDKYIALGRKYDTIFDVHILGKNNPPPFKNKQYLNDVEYIITFRNSGSTFNDNLEYDLYRKIIMVNCLQDNQHPAQKNITAVNKYIRILSNPNDLVLDPFLGSGTTAFAAKMLGRKCIGIEISEKYCEIAAKRCSQNVFNLDC